MSRRCRTCHAALDPRPYESVQVESCPQCTGVFVAHEALASVANDELVPRSDDERRAALARSIGAPVDDGDVAIRRCPACGEAMRRHVYAFSSGVVVDTCDPHGVWLDPGELQRVEAWSEAMRHGTTLDPDDSAAPVEVGGDGLRFAPGSVLGLLRALER